MVRSPPAPAPPAAPTMGYYVPLQPPVAGTVEDGEELGGSTRAINAYMSCNYGRGEGSSDGPEFDPFYKLWLYKEEEIFKDITCCAVAFRLLRIKGFEVSSDFLVPYAERDHISLQTTSVSTILELYRASQIRIHEDETNLDAINEWTTTFLKQQLLSETIPDKKLQEKVEYELKNFHGILGRIGNRRSLDLYDVENYHVMKAAYRCPTIYNEEFLIYSRQDFNICQALHQKEFQRLERWYSDCGLDRLNFGRDALRMAHFMASAIFGDRQLVDARMSFAKNVVLIARIDDFFDQHGSREESYKILDLVKEWNEKPTVEYGFQEVEILFTAVYRTVNELAEMAYVAQGRCVKHHLISLWVEILTSFVKEFDTWCEDDAINLDKEKEERRVNAVSILKESDDENEEMAVSKIEKLIEYNRRKLLRMVYKRETIVPRKCKDLFSEICKMGYYLYSSSGGDEFTSPQQIMEDVKSLIHQPLYS
ncbi:PREDICTED: beta-phellandrene synthase (neryl-diphosphate-cyclizing), chloroplastic-like [Erythranthe guttata]|uniref:beta-phellandrene synthase (neryl-diphosphate-cyclizing), chloroplastic-like n=1 Tax=Erythranthe guttata TaxID=4155 RepID=UPI00064DD3A7|nr:PREDICTED: beta-phellandrene synthase (neryl-diphosphate-cyclizing), chloroplastic-like [Erythranthe guttata]|eukprot:XP_012841016.1 PREDICTED: beta-phellandrene synthase (neryl-diphosphate-cyclizing), chloroplastic-like [Erythranthe guttata]